MAGFRNASAGQLQHPGACNTSRSTSGQVGNLQLLRHPRHRQLLVNHHCSGRHHHIQRPCASRRMRRAVLQLRPSLFRLRLHLCTPFGVRRLPDQRTSANWFLDHPSAHLVVRGTKCIPSQSLQPPGQPALERRGGVRERGPHARRPAAAAAAGGKGRGDGARVYRFEAARHHHRAALVRRAPGADQHPAMRRRLPEPPLCTAGDCVRSNTGRPS
jgi:hypothetical protein